MGQRSQVLFQRSCLSLYKFGWVFFATHGFIDREGLIIALESDLAHDAFARHGLVAHEVRAGSWFAEQQMIADWIYNNPTWLWGTILVGLAAGVGGLGLLVVHRLVHIEVRRAHNELAGFLVAVISVTYAVLLAFIAVATWESFSHAQDIVDSEADYVGSIYRDTQGLPPAVGQSIRDDLQEYVTAVVNQEWPVQREGKTPDQGWAPLRKLHSSIVTIEPTTMGQEVIQGELLKVLNELYSARASRLSAVQGHIPDVVWWIILFGGVITVGFTYLFGFHDFRMHVVMTMTVAASLALVVVLIVALDWPFRGEVSISPDAYSKTQKSWGDLPFNTQVGRTGDAPEAVRK